MIKKTMTLLLVLLGFVTSTSFSAAFNESCNPAIDFKNINQFNQISKKIIENRNASNIQYSKNPSLTVVEYQNCKIIYIITGKSHFSFPTIVKRIVVKNGKEIHIDTQFSTLASKNKINKWMHQFKQLNKKISNQMNSAS